MAVLIKRENWATDLHTGKRPCKGKGRDGGDTSMSHRSVANHQKLSEKHGADSPAQSPEGTNPSGTLV